ncbi:hypothetical protein LZ518_00645 [Sphingomonas sp. RB56-2]|uniref:Energy transducer TonB n=1 Tax=Sphingomonas brevis TaxID=2908206 RepID=A0ABT0S5I6_9SPHN|nr:hypothetical protein [Sphingomonas brevis]MCL6739652.1 hypothetical protein [Sphingomonas brevis]
MQSYYPSRTRIFFEVLCAFAMVTSCVGAWRQTGASALLIAAAVAALYGLVHLFDMRRPKPAEAVEPQRIDFEPETLDVVVPMVAVEEPPTVDPVVAEAEVVDISVAARTGSGRRSGGSRKTGGRRTKAPKAEKAAEVAPVVQEDAPVEEFDALPPLAAEPELAEVGFEEDEFVFPADDEPAPQQIQPLFEPEPFVRMPRQGFGRRGRL